MKKVEKGSRDSAGIVCSVVILTYKQLDWLPKVLASIVNQSYKNIEIVIADDGTPDFDNQKIENLCKLYCSKDNIPYIIAHLTENNGTVKNFNNGIKSSHGEIIIPMAGDNQFWDTSVIEQIVDSFKREQWLIATGKQVLSCENQELEVRPYANEICMIKNKNTGKLALRLAMFPCFIGGAATIYTQKVFKNYGVFDEGYKLLEDCPYYIKVLQQGERFAFIDSILIKHNIELTDHKRNKYLIEDDIRVIDEILNTEIKLTFREKRMLKYRKQMLIMESGEQLERKENYLDCKINWIFYRVINKIGKEINAFNYKRERV